MKLCPHCKAELYDNARFCLCCMTSLDEKEQIPPPVRKLRRWPLVLLGALILCIGLTVALLFQKPEVQQAPPAAPSPETTEAPAIYTQTIDGVRYTFRPATEEDHPSSLPLGNYFVLTRVEGTPSDGIYRVPSFLGSDTTALVTAVADSAFSGTDAKIIDLGYNVRFVWGDAFYGCQLTDLYLHEDVLIEENTLSHCTKELTIHCPDYLENTQGQLWSELALRYGFRWQRESL